MSQGRAATQGLQERLAQPSSSACSSPHLRPSAPLTTVARTASITMLAARASRPEVGSSAQRHRRWHMPLETHRMQLA
jgi:hypothetical protein